ncbi:MAG: LTA synthase family protein [Epsilonproteobacteria bacterium]|nr:LTA synthase family protein [Campylobacterota bacterium]
MQLIKQLFKYYLSLVSIFFIGRLLLFFIYFDKFTSCDIDYYLTFIYGLRIDTIVASILLIIPTILLTLSPKRLTKIIDTFLKYYFLIILSCLIYMEIATFPFMAQYDVRPNYLFVEYLEYPKKVFEMIFAEYKLELIFAFIVISSFIYIYLKKYKDRLDAVLQIDYFKRILLFIPLALLILMGIRSSFGHRPANISDAMYSSDRTINEITKNSLYSIGYAMYINAKHGGKRIMEQYPKMDINEAMTRVKKRLNITNIENSLTLKRLESTHFKTKEPKNLVIFLQESLGAQFVEATSGEAGITPHLNALAKEGILFTNLYSNGTRSVRGIAGMVAGNFSIPGKGVVKRNKSQKDYFTIAKVLKPCGYHTSFIYGGESRFDNMKGWFLGNGFDEIIDQPKFKNPKFTGTWGVCDEEVVIRANEEFKKLHKKHQKFASVIFSTSNHSPFDFPDNKIKLIDGIKKKSVKNAIKYADFAIGRLIELAKKEPYYKDTVFVIAADHNVRVYGKDMVPVNMFQIPAVIVGGDIKPYAFDKVSTQPDVLATALDLIGIDDLSYPIMGHSIFSDKKRDIALMQFNSFYALRSKDKVAVVVPNKAPFTFLYEDKHLKLTKHDEKLEKDLSAFIIVLNYLYDKKLYK